MVDITRLHGMSFALEDADGVYTSPFTAGTSSFLAIDPNIDFNPELYKRNIRKGSLTPQQPLIGAKPGKMTFGLEMTGTSSGTPQIGQPLQVCGMRQETLGKFTIGAVTGGPFKHGEVWTQATSGATGIVVGDTYTGQTTLWFARLITLGTGTPNGTNVITGGTSGATATPSAVGVTNQGIGWWPASIPLNKLLFTTNISNNIANGDILTNGSGAYMMAYGTFTSATTLTQVLARQRGASLFANGDTITNVTQSNSVGTLAASASNVQQVIPSASCGMYKDGTLEAMRGARGTFKMDGKVGEPMLFNFDLSGSYQSVTDGANVASISYPQTLPPTLLDADLGVGKAATTFAAEFAPCITNFGIDIGNTVSPRRCMNDSSGILGFQITDRSATFTIDPEMDLETIWDYMGQFLAGTPTRARLTVGSAAGNQFLIQMPAVSFTQVATGDRDGIATRQITASLNSGSQTSLSGDNELVIIFRIV